VITNIDREHLDHYRDLEAIRQAFTHFANRVPFYGVSILCADDDEIAAILPRITKRTILYGTRPQAQVRAEGIALEPHGVRFTVVAEGRRAGEVRLQVPGRHNALNALAAVAVGLEVDVAFAHIAEALAEFHGVARRFETRGTACGVRVIDDYGHHPTEIAATLGAAKGLGGRVLVVFQPHRYSRTHALANEFGGCFRDADRVWLLDVYAAGETPIPGVSSDTIVASARRQGAAHVEHAPDAARAVSAVAAEARPGDVVLTLGAGDVWKLADEILVRLAATAATGPAPAQAAPAGKGGRVPTEGGL
jgi:UDP-N-acetylmuramate--alanine ligase